MPIEGPLSHSKAGSIEHSSQPQRTEGMKPLERKVEKAVENVGVLPEAPPPLLTQREITQFPALLPTNLSSEHVTGVLSTIMKEKNITSTADIGIEAVAAHHFTEGMNKLLQVAGYSTTGPDPCLHRRAGRHGGEGRAAARRQPRQCGAGVRCRRHAAGDAERGRSAAARSAPRPASRRARWLRMLAEGTELAPEFLEYVREDQAPRPGPDDHAGGQRHGAHVGARDRRSDDTAPDQARAGAARRQGGGHCRAPRSGAGHRADAGCLVRPALTRRRAASLRSAVPCWTWPSRPRRCRRSRRR